MTFNNFKKSCKERLLSSCKITNEKVYITEEEKSNLESKNIKVYPEYDNGATRYYFENSLKLSDDDFKLLINLKSQKDINVIKKCVMFFTVLSLSTICLYVLVFLFRLYVSK